MFIISPVVRHGFTKVHSLSEFKDFQFHIIHSE